MLTWSTILIAAIIYPTVFGQQDIEDIVDDVFPKPSTISNQDSGTVSGAIDLHPDFRNTSSDTTDIGINCTCVHYYQCANGTIIRNGKGIIDIRINTNPCENNLQVCCSLKDVNERGEPLRPTLKTPTGCGHRNRDGVSFEITGATDNEAQFGEFPWMVAILQEKTMKYQCGGALIHPQVVLTAAHCVIDRNKSFRIRAGEWDSQHREEPYPYQDRVVQSVTIHPEYYSGALFNDVALLILSSPVEEAENIGVVCLPPHEDIVQSGRCFATGWGKDIFGKEGKYQVILKKIDLPIIPNRQCQKKLRATRLGRFFDLHSSFICAGGEPNKDTCNGDGGSPLVCPVAGTTDTYYQAGIVSWGIGCGGNDIPGVYANVAKFRNWIDEQMNSGGFSTSSYQS